MAQRALTFPKSEVDAARDFLQHVEARLASDPAVRNEFRRVLQSFFRRSISAGEKPDPREARADLFALLRGHPDLVDGLDAIIKTEPASEDPARSRRPRRERRPTSAADDRAHIHRALRYLHRVRARRPGLHDRLIALLFHLGSGEEDGNEIYDRALEVFGSKDGDLLREFTEYLPIPTESDRDLFLRRLAKKEPPHAEHVRAPAPKRKATAAVTASNPIAAKRPRADDRKTTNRRANSPAVVVDAAPKSGGVSAFREAWEFETTYTKLVATARRTKELLKHYEPPKNAPPSWRPPSGRRSFEELFPSRECQEVLREMYDGMLGHIREALEDGARTELALRTIKRRLGMLEQAAVKMAMERRDRARVEGRMQKLAGDRVLVLRKEQARLAARRHVVAARGDPDVHSVKRTEVDQPTLVRC